MSLLKDGELIEQVESFSFIYNKNDPLFKDKIAKENAWQTIAAILDVSPDECEQRWSILRNRFTTELRHLKNTPSGSQATSQWALFKALSFLTPFISARRTRGNITKSSLKSPETSHSVWDNYSQITEPEQGSAALSTEETDFMEGESSTTPSTSKTPSTGRRSVEPTRMSELRADTRACKRRKVEGELESALKETMTGFTSYINQKNILTSRPVSPETADMSFGRVVASYLSEIKNPKKKRLIQRKILDVFIEGDSEESN
ncbi:unnamed protein product [Brassicogethes aeneus]|uniref:MADF domain-containing protein n=1 Tax=Brassicogethes aeneus TaxID=1431903 RepID=A0A9P0ATH8_BRAAE|nr:unnamed protein product [Brassicogethes aeneus]